MALIGAFLRLGRSVHHSILWPGTSPGDSARAELVWRQQTIYSKAEKQRSWALDLPLVLTTIMFCLALWQPIVYLAMNWLEQVNKFPFIYLVGALSYLLVAKFMFQNLIKTPRELARFVNVIVQLARLIKVSFYTFATNSLAIYKQLKLVLNKCPRQRWGNYENVDIV